MIATLIPMSVATVHFWGRGALVAASILLVLSAVKFATVVGFFMHLRFDNPLFLAVFGFGLAVAGSVITAFMFLFGQYPQPPHG